MSQLQKLSGNEKILFLDAVGGPLTGKIIEKLPYGSMTCSYGVLSHTKISGIIFLIRNRSFLTYFLEKIN